ncbi:MAG: TonB-dependent receptor [Proteobacteria bacterium]|nr:TonB-dependent receptor [Pseudomonadota bacterium]
MKHNRDFMITAVKTTGLTVSWLVIALNPATGFAAQDRPHVERVLEELVVTAPFAETEAETALPIGVLSGEELREKVGNSLGDTLKNEIGVNNASFGTGVGQPIIRGQSGNRVSILQNGVGLTDASNVSPDHANGVEAIVAERIEVLRGPSALLYGSGAIGGVVNVIDGRIPERLVDATQFLIEQSHFTASDEDKTVIKLESAGRSLGFHLDAFQRENGNMEVAGSAIDETALKQLANLYAQQAGVAEQVATSTEERALINTRGFVANSNGESHGATVGISHIADSGFVGFSVGILDNEYGLPPGLSAHDVEEDNTNNMLNGQDVVRVKLDQSRYDIKGQYDFNDRWFESIKVNVGYTDYEHAEIEIEADGNQSIGTVFQNKGIEGRMTLNHDHLGGWGGVLGMQFSQTEFSASGDEAFIPESAIDSIGVFGVERFQRQALTSEFGFRVERNRIDTGSRCDFSETSTSLSASLLYDINAQSNLLAGITRSQRAASVEELYSNISPNTCSRFALDDELVLHAATGLLEIGNPSLDKEISSNIELGLRKHAGKITGEISAYFNQIRDFIYLELTGEGVNEQLLASYQSQDATFRGLEAELSIEILESANRNLVLGFFGDLVDASFDAGGDVPRIPAAKIGAELRFFGNNWSTHLHVTRVLKQNDVAAFELPSDAYTLLSLYGDYHWGLSNSSDIKVFVKADNLLDEKIRNHASLMKNYSPEPGRGIRLGVRWEY